MKNIIILILVLQYTLGHSQSVKINCGSTTKLKKDVNLGYLNIKGASLGEIYSVKFSGNKIKELIYLSRKAVDSSNLNVSSVVDLKEYKTKINFNLEASGEISKDLKVELTNEIAKDLIFKLFNSKIETIIDPTLQINYLEPDLFPIKSGDKYILINRVIKADSLLITTSSGLDIGGNAKLSVGPDSLQIINNCNEFVQLVGKEVPTFFEFIVFTPSISKENKKVIGLVNGNKSKSTKVKVANWEMADPLELTEDAIIKNYIEPEKESKSFLIVLFSAFISFLFGRSSNSNKTNSKSRYSNR